MGPERGYFDWVDNFLEENTDYTELSDRKLLNWAHKSGVKFPVLGTNDKPSMHLGTPPAEMWKVLYMTAAAVKRNYLVPELKANLISSERKNAMSQFGRYRKKAIVFMGEPDEKYKTKVQARIHAGKRAEAVALKRHKRIEALKVRAQERI